MIFSAFQYLADLYWAKKWSEKIFWTLSTFSLIFFVYYFASTNFIALNGLLRIISPIFIVNFSKFQGDFGLFFAELQVIGMFFGFGIAFVGSQSIQYSLTKILLRYGYFKILSINFILLFLYQFTYNFDAFFIILISLWMSLLYVHSFFLMDKVFDPEEIILEVIVPSISIFENALVSKNKSGSSTIYGISQGYVGKRKPLIYNPSSILLAHSNAELDDYGKALRRLIKSGSLKLNHFFNIIFGHIYENEWPLVELDKRYSKSCDIETFAWFILTYFIYIVYEVAQDNEEYGYLRIELMVQVFTRLLSRENYKEGAHLFGTLEQHTSLLDYDGYRGKDIIVGIITTQMTDDLGEHAPDKNEQIARFAYNLLHQYVFDRIPSLATCQGLEEVELIYLAHLLGLANEVYERVDDLKMSDEDWVEEYLQVYFTLIIFKPWISAREQILLKNDRKSFKVFITNILLDKVNWTRNKKVLVRLASEVEYANEYANMTREKFTGHIKKGLQNLLEERITPAMETAIKEVLEVAAKKTEE